MDQQLKQALELHKRGDHKQALDQYVRILNKDHPPLVAFLNASSIWRSHEKYDLSINCLKRGLSLYPSEPGLWNNLGNCHLDTNAVCLAVSAYRRALGLEPEFVDSRISLATCLRELGHIHLAYAILVCRYHEKAANEERQRLLIPLQKRSYHCCQWGNKLKPQDMESFIEMVERKFFSR